MPRRAALIYGTIAVACFQLLQTGLTKYAADRINTGGSHTSDGFGISYGFSIATIAIGQLSGICYCFGYTPLQAVVPTEALETTTRAKGLAFSSFIMGGVGFIGQFAAPIGLNNMGYNYMWVFVGLDFFWIIVFYFSIGESFLGQECRGSISPFADTSSGIARQDPRGIGLDRTYKRSRFSRNARRGGGGRRRRKVVPPQTPHPPYAPPCVSCASIPPRYTADILLQYEQPNPVNASKRKDKIIVETDGHVDIVDEGNPA